MNSEYDDRLLDSGLRKNDKILQLIGEHGPGLAFLRYKRTGLQHSEEGDWDFACHDLQKTSFVSRELLGRPLLKVKHQYVVQQYFEWGQLDLLPIFAWNGRVYLDQDRFWAKVVIEEDGIPRPCLAHDAVIAWLTDALREERYNSRYDSLLNTAFARESVEMCEVLNKAFGEQLTAQLVGFLRREKPEKITLIVKNLRRALTMRTIGAGGLSAISRCVQHWVVEIGNHIKPPFPWIAILGPDGSGKSAVIQGIEDHFRLSRIGIVSVHWRPRIRAGLNGGQGEVVTDPHGIPPRGWVLSIAALILLVFRWWIALLLRVIHVRATKKMMISDRYYNDLLVDPRHYRYGGPLSLARLLFRLIPSPEKTVILLTDSQTILARKEEVAPDELERQLLAYRDLAEDLGSQKASLVDVGRPLDLVVKEVSEITKEVLRKRS